MELIVHGTKGGYRLFDKSKTSYTTTGDIRDYLHNSIGESLFTLNFKNDGVSISKVTIIEDLGRGAFGFLAVTLFLPKEEKLAGKDIHELLNNSTSHYLNTYTIQRELPENTREDWPQFDQIKNEYRSRLSPITDHDQRHFEQASNAKKYLFYSNISELETIFDYPFYAEFNGPKIIFLVDRKYEGNHDCPLNVAHSDIAKGELSINLENPEYTLKSLPIDVQVFRGNQRNIYDGDKIRKQENLTIIWKKEFFDDHMIDKSIAEIMKDPHNPEFSLIKIGYGELTINPKYDFNPSKKSIKIINKNKQKISFSLQCDEDIKNSSDNVFDFFGEEIGRNWKVDTQTPFFKANPGSIQPKYTKEPIIEISFEEYREYRNFDIKDVESGTEIKRFSITINGKNYSQNDTIQFTKDLDEECRYFVNADDYEGKDGKFKPKDKSEFPAICLKKAAKVNAPSSLGQGQVSTPSRSQGKLSIDVKEIGNPTRKGPSDLEFLKPNRKTLLAVLALAIVIAVVGYLVFSYFNESKNVGQTTHLDYNNISDYCKGDTLDITELENYQQNNCKPLDEGGEADQSRDKELCVTVEEAIKFREALNSGDFDYLDDTLRTKDYPKLRGVLDKIKKYDSLRTKVIELMKDSTKIVSKMTISQVVDNLETHLEITTLNEAKVDKADLDSLKRKTGSLKIIDLSTKEEYRKKLNQIQPGKVPVEHAPLKSSASQNPPGPNKTPMTAVTKQSDQNSQASLKNPPNKSNLSKPATTRNAPSKALAPASTSVKGKPDQAKDNNRLKSGKNETNETSKPTGQAIGGQRI
jgi:hypothetical protein